MILIIDNYDSFTYNIYQYFEELGQKCVVIRNDQITLSEIKTMNPKAIVISPGPGNPDSSGISQDIIKTLSKSIPTLGICLGHQVIGQVFGGKVVRAKKILHGKTSKMYHEEKGVFKNLPNPFIGVRYHSLIIDRDSLPECLEITCETKDGIIMGVKHKEFPLEGIQFHPESIMTQDGKKLLQNFIDMYKL